MCACLIIKGNVLPFSLPWLLRSSCGQSLLSPLKFSMSLLLRGFLFVCFFVCFVCLFVCLFVSSRRYVCACLVLKGNVLPFN